MPWKEVSLMTARAEFLALAQQLETNNTHLARRFGIARKKYNSSLAPPSPTSRIAIASSPPG